MKVKARKTFSGTINMEKGQIKECPEQAARDLINIGLAEEVKEEEANEFGH